MVTEGAERHVQIFSAMDLRVVQELDDPKLNWIVSAEYATRSRQTLAAQTKAATGLIVDPVTWRLDPDLKWMAAKDGGLKPIYRRIAETFRLPADDIPWRERTADHLERFVVEVLEFQERQLDTSRNTDDEELFGDLLPPSIGRSRPDRLFAPTQFVRDLDDLSDQLTIWAATPSDFRGLPVDLVLAVAPRLLVDATALARITAAVPPGRRLWLFIPRFRQLLRAPSGMTVAAGIRPAVRRLLDRGPIGLLQAGHHLSMLAIDGVDAIGFALHLEGGAERKGKGRPALPYAYATAAHGLATYQEIAHVVRGLETGIELAHWFCPEAQCVARFEELGARAYVKEMFGTQPTQNGVQAHPRSHAMQRRHGLRARLWELDRIARLPELELVRILAAEARRTPFDRARMDLEAWLEAFSLERVPVRR